MSGAKSRGEDEEKRRDESRAVWERPALRRLAANEAQGGQRIIMSPDSAQYQS
jgi:hypothetical protein